MSAVGWPEIDPARRPTLRTERLVLAPPSEADVPALVATADDFEVARWLARMPHPYGEADARRFIDEISPGEPVWTIRPRAGGALMGTVGLKPVARDTGELGYWLARAAWGSGYGTEAARCVVDYAFGTMRLARLEAIVLADNHGSINLLAKLGFRSLAQTMKPSVILGRDALHEHMVLLP